MIDKPKRKRRTKAEMEVEKKRSNDNAPKDFKSLLGKRINYNGQRVTIVTHYYNGLMELETPEGRIIKYDPTNPDKYNKIKTNTAVEDKNAKRHE